MYSISYKYLIKMTSFKRLLAEKFMSKSENEEIYRSKEKLDLILDNAFITPLITMIL